MTRAQQAIAHDARDGFDRAEVRLHVDAAPPHFADHARRIARRAVIDADDVAAGLRKRDCHARAETRVAAGQDR